MACATRFMWARFLPFMMEEFDLIRSWNVLTRPREVAELEHRTIFTVQEDKEMLEAQHRVRVRSPKSTSD